MSDKIKVNSELPQKLATLGQVKDALNKRDEKIDSLKEDIGDIITQSPNLFNPLTIKKNVKIDEVYNVTNLLDDTQYTQDSQHAVIIIKVDPSKTYKSNIYTNFWKKNEFAPILCADETGLYKGQVPSILNDDGTANYTVQINGSSAKTHYIAIEISFWSNYDLNTLMFCEADKYPSKYVSYGKEPGIVFDNFVKKSEFSAIQTEVTQNATDIENIKTSLGVADLIPDVPSLIDFVVGVPYYGYFSGFYKTDEKDFDEYTFWNYNGTDNTYLYGRNGGIFNLTPSAQTVISNARTYYSLNEKQVENRFIAYHNPKITNPTEIKNVLVVGDSYTLADKWLPHMVATYLQDCTNIKFIGSNGTVKREATGGFTWQNYLDNPSTLPSGYAKNPFWSDELNDIDLQGYVNQYSTNGQLDYMILPLGINSFVNGKYFDDRYNGNIDTAIADIEVLCKKIHQ